MSNNSISGEDQNALISESRVLFDELKRHVSGEEVDSAVAELIEFQHVKKNVNISEEMHLPVPMLGYRHQENPVLVISICEEFSRRKVLDLPKDVNDFAAIYDYKHHKTQSHSFEEPIDYIRNFKEIRYFGKIDWMLRNIWKSKDYEIGEKSVYANIIPWPTPSKWTGFQKYEHFQRYGKARVKRLIENLKPNVIVSLGRQTSEFLGRWDKLISKNNKIKKGFSDLEIPLISLTRPVASNELKSFTYYESGLSDWEAKFLAHLDKIQEYLGIE